MTGWTPPALPAQWTWTADLPPWVGRRRELEQLELYWAAVEHGARQLVFVSGEPGSGKSRLVMEASVALHARGIPVLVGHCTSDLGLPFDPLVAPVRSLLRAVGAGELPLVDSEAVPAEDVGRLLAVLTSGAEAEVNQTSLAVVALGAVVAALSAACATGPVALVLEDLHWAGDSGLRGLRHIVERTASLPLLILATHRNTPPDVSDTLPVMSSALLGQSGVHHIELDGLATSEVASYLTALQAGDAPTVGRAANRLRDATGGNPFLLGEICREVRDQGGLARLASGQLAVPGSLQSMVRGRLGRLAPAERNTVGRGAVIGEVFTVELLRATGAEKPESPEEVYRGLAAATALGLIRALPDRLGAYCFPHALARQAVLAELGPYTVASTHAAVAAALEPDGDLPDPSRLLQLAHHYEMAVGLGLEGRAAHYLELSAEIAMARLAHSDAATLFERAGKLAPGRRERNRLMLRAGTSWVQAGRLERAQALSEVVATSGDTDSELEAALLNESASYVTGAGAVRAAELLQNAMNHSPLAEGARQRLLALASHGRGLVVMGRHLDGEAELEQALAAARAGSDQHLVLAVLDRCLSQPANLGGHRGGDWLRHHRDYAVEASALARLLGAHESLGWAAQARAYCAYVLGELEDLDLALADLEGVVSATRSTFWLWRSKLLAASRHLMKCEFATTATSLAESRRMASSFGYRWERMDGPWSLHSYLYRRETGGLEFARAALAGGDGPANPWAPGLAAIYSELGLADRARTVLHHAIDHELDKLRDSVTWPASLSLLAETAILLGDRAGANALLADAEVFSGFDLMAAEFLAPFGSADRLVAGLRAVLGRGGVEEHFAAALDLDTRMGAPLHVATTEAEWAAWLMRSKVSAARIDEHRLPALRLADRYGLVRVRRLLHAEPEGRAPTSAGLTARELEVLRLIGRGGSNKSIAAELFISEHTAANHVRSILMKTGAANRTAAAHYARTRGLLDGESGDRHP